MAGYGLGVDIGTTWTAAAIARAGSDPQVVSLGGRTAAVPTVVHVLADRSANVGDAAERRAVTDADRVAREFKRRVGDTTPVLLGGQPWSPESLMATVLRWVVGRVTELEGEPPATIVVTHPANWGPLRRELLEQAVEHSGVTARFVTEPEAAAVHYASATRVPDGSVVAVYDLGGGTFDATVLRKEATGFALLGPPQGVERLGGLDFDAAVLAHVTAVLGPAWHALDPTDPATASGVLRLRADCVLAKEALSEDADATVSVALPTVSTDIRLTRGELESMIRPAIEQSADALGRAVDAAGVVTAEVDRILLVGGSSRIPLVSQVLTTRFGRPLALDTHPKHAVALGAARLALGTATLAPPVAPVAPFAPVAPEAASAAAVATAAVAGAPTPSWAATAPPGEPPPQEAPAPEPPPSEPPPQEAPALEPPPSEPPDPPSRLPEPEPAGGGGRRFPMWIPVVVVVAVVALVAALVLGGGDDGDDDVASDAFCSTLSDLSDEVAIADLSDEGQVAEVAATVDELVDDAVDDDQAAAAEDVASTFADESDDPDALAGAVQDEFGGFAEDCGIDSFATASGDDGSDGSTVFDPEIVQTLDGGWFFDGSASDCQGLAEEDCAGFEASFTSDLTFSCDGESCQASIATSDPELLADDGESGLFSAGLLSDDDGFTCDGLPDPTEWQLFIGNIDTDGDNVATSFDATITLTSQGTGDDGNSCVFEQVVADGVATRVDDGGSDPDGSSAALTVTLEWPSNADLDLLVLDPDGSDPESTGGEHSGDDNTQCGGDDSGFEQVIWTTVNPPPSGEWQVDVQAFEVDSGGCGGADYTLTVQVGDEEPEVFTGSVASDSTETHTFFIE